MLDARTALRDCTNSSLVFFDELGRGTDVVAGSALAGAILEHFDSIGCAGIFCTHLHPLLDLPLKLGNVKRYAMEVENQNAEDGSTLLKPTMRMIPGESRETLAFQTASMFGVDENIVQRAADLIEAVDVNKSSSIISRQISTITEKCSPLSDLRDSTEAKDAHLLNHSEIENLKSSSLVSPSIAEASDILHRVASTIGCEMCSDKEYLDLDIGIVKPNEVPSPLVYGVSTVYIMRDISGVFYCGESDDLARRISAHRSRSSDQKKAEFVYVPVRGGKSLARAIEMRTIQELLRANFPMRSARDMVNRSFGIGTKNV